MPRYRLTIAYDGADFCGWQKQEPPAASPRIPASAILPPADPLPDSPNTPPRRGGCQQPSEAPPLGGTARRAVEEGAPPRLILRTVQEVVERAVREVVREPIILHGASRTDSGVHARAQTAAFTTTPGDRGRGWPADRGAEPLLRAINSRLPHDVLITAASLAPDDFDPVNDCIAKEYSYSILVSPHRPLWSRRYVTHLVTPLDLVRMRRAAAYLVGEHDFAAFAAAGHGRLTTVRTVLACDVTSQTAHLDPGELIRITVRGTGFLYNQVRIMAGTLVEVGRNKIDPDAIPGIIASLDRSRAGPTMRPEGLCLERIWYRGDNID